MIAISLFFVFLCFQPGKYNFKAAYNESIIFSSPCWVFTLSLVGFLAFPVEYFFLGLTLRIFWKSGVFAGEISSPNRGTETGCLCCYCIVFGKIRLLKSWSEGKNPWETRKFLEKFSPGNSQCGFASHSVIALFELMKKL